MKINFNKQTNYKAQRSQMNGTRQQKLTYLWRKFLQGDPPDSFNAEVLMVCPPHPPYDGETEIGDTGLDTGPEHTFRSMLEGNGIQVDNHFFKVRSHFLDRAKATKATKRSTEQTKAFVLECARFKLFSAYVCVSEESFRFIFGNGKKTYATTLIGSKLLIPELDFVPLYTFADPAHLEYNITGNKREDWKNECKCREFEGKLQASVENYIAFLKDISGAQYPADVIG